MLITKTAPVGLDIAIQAVQTKLHTALLLKWGIDTADYRCYGRCYRNKQDNGYIAENYEGEGQYKEVYWDDTLKAISFFGSSANTQMDINSKVDVHLIFFVNLAKLKPAILHRADEEVRQDVVSVIGKNSFGLELQSIETWLENVLREYPGSRRDNRLNAVDMQPQHCFRINFTMYYNFLKKC